VELHWDLVLVFVTSTVHAHSLVANESHLRVRLPRAFWNINSSAREASVGSEVRACCFDLFWRWSRIQSMATACSISVPFYYIEITSIENEASRVVDQNVTSWKPQIGRHFFLVELVLAVLLGLLEAHKRDFVSAHEQVRGLTRTVFADLGCCKSSGHDHTKLSEASDNGLKKSAPPCSSRRCFFASARDDARKKPCTSPSVDSYSYSGLPTPK
jgi:hypothetical protein